MGSPLALLIGWFAILSVLGVGALRWARRGRLSTGLPRGRIVYSDMGGWRRPEKPLFSSEHRLTGRPDYLVRRGRRLIPVEVKPTRRSARPYASDVFQLAAYCLLLEESAGKPPYGLLRYSEQTYRIPYTRRLRRQVLRVLADMRRADGARDVPPNHDESARCRGCGHRIHCDHRMA